MIEGHTVTPDEKFWCECQCRECQSMGSHRWLRHDPSYGIEYDHCPTCGQVTGQRVVPQ